MQLVNYKPQSPPTPISNKIKELFLIQKPRQFKVQKPSLNPSPQTTSQIAKTISTTQPKINQIIKTKIITKTKQNQVRRQPQRQIQKRYNEYLVNYLHQSNIEAIRDRQPPSLSLLEFKEEGDYPDEKKDTPHFSNVIKLDEIPRERKMKSIPKVQKKIEADHFNWEENSVLKVKEVYNFTKLIFRVGNEEFQSVAERINCSQKMAKLLFDLLDDYFNMEKTMSMSRHQSKWKHVKKIRKFVTKAIIKYKSGESRCLYIPLEQEYISLKEIRQCLNRKFDEAEEPKSDSQ